MNWSAAASLRQNVQLGLQVFDAFRSLRAHDPELGHVGADRIADLGIRDNLADTCAVPSVGWHANSPDIWVRRAGDPIPALAYGDAPPHQNPLRGQDNYVLLRVRNVGTASSNEVCLRALITHFPGFEFRYPEERVPTALPSTYPPSPFVPGTYLIGEALIDNLAPAASTIVKI